MLRAVLSLWIVVCGASYPGPPERLSTGHTGANAGTSQNLVPRIEEDSPGWDCQTMGNLICGENR